MGRERFPESTHNTGAAIRMLGGEKKKNKPVRSLSNNVFLYQRFSAVGRLCRAPWHFGREIQNGGD